MDHWKLCPVPVQLGVPSALNWISCPVQSGTIATLFSPKQTYMRNAKLHGWAGASCYLEMPGQEAMSWLSVTTFCFKSHQQQIWQTCVTSFLFLHICQSLTFLCNQKLEFLLCSSLMFTIFIFSANCCWNFLGCPGEERRGLIAGVSIREVWPHLERRGFQFCWTTFCSTAAKASSSANL